MKALRAPWIPLAASLFLAFALACQRFETPDKVAITFLELYVFKADQQSALELADGDAAAKLEREISDLAAVRSIFGDFASDPRRPALKRELLSADKDADGSTRFTYRIEVRPKGGETSHRDITIRVAKPGAKWRVVDYEFLKGDGAL